MWGGQFVSLCLGKAALTEPSHERAPNLSARVLPDAVEMEWPLPGAVRRAPSKAETEEAWFQVLSIPVWAGGEGHTPFVLCQENRVI